MWLRRTRSVSDGVTSPRRSRSGFAGCCYFFGGVDVDAGPAPVKLYTYAVPFAPATANLLPSGLMLRSRQFAGTLSAWTLSISSPFQNHTRPCPAPPAAITAPDGWNTTPHAV